MIKLEYKNYNPNYPHFFSNEKEILETAFPNEVEIIHIGSTSIFGLGGKAIIDIMAASEKNKLIEIKNKLLNLEYNYHQEISFGGRDFFSKDKRNNKDMIRIHLHLTSKNSSAHKKAIAFKDYLSSNKKIAINYQNFKIETMKKTQGDYKKYREIKNKYIDKILKSIY